MDALPSVAAIAWGAANGVDFLAVTLLAVGAVVGGFRGLTGELSRIGGLVVAVLVGYWTAGPWTGLAAAWVPGEGQAAVGRGLVTVVGVAVSATVAGQVARILLNRFLRLLLDQPADAVFGIVVGTLRSALLIVLLFFIASFVAHGEFGKTLFVDSIAGRAAHPAVQWARERTGGIDRFAPGSEAPEEPPSRVPASAL